MILEKHGVTKNVTGCWRRFPTYPEYKVSGVEWLGEIPAHWEVTRTKFAARLRSGHTPSRQHPEYWQNCTIPWFGLADVWQIRDGHREYVSETSEKISELGLANSAARLLPKGTVILSRTASVGFSAIMDTEMATTQDFVNWVCGPRLRPEYLLYLFRSMSQEFGRLTMGSTHKTIYMPDVGNFSTPVPPLREQDGIVAFVRRETAKIDALVAKKERLIELLQEKRTALITQAVTKGLDPKVPMKDSGVEWLGEVPAHWQTVKIKRLFHQSKRQDHPSLTVLSVYRDFGVIEKSSRDDNINRTPEDLTSYQLVEVGDLVINKMKAWQGSLGISDYRGITSPDYMVYTPRHSENLRFLHHLLRDKLLADVYRSASNGIRPSQWRLEPDKFENLVVFLPPKGEQNEISTYLDKGDELLETLIGRAEGAVQLLKEFRTALISAAVTGKIDVRDEVVA